MAYDDETGILPDRPGLNADLDRLDKELADAKEALLVLRKRVDSVLVPSVPAPAEKGIAAGGDGQSAVRGKVKTLVRSASVLGDIAREITTRVDM